MNEDFENKEYREAFVEENIRNGIAFQIRALRKRHQLSQEQLGQRAGMAQNVISRLEDPEYGKFTINTLLTLATAFDVALIVKFVPFSELFRSLKNLSPEVLAASSFAEEKEERRNVGVRLMGRVECMSSMPASGNRQRDLPPFERVAPTGALSALEQSSQREPNIREFAK